MSNYERAEEMKLDATAKSVFALAHSQMYGDYGDFGDFGDFGLSDTQ